MSTELIRDLHAYSPNGNLRNRTREELALLPSLECFNVNAFANYALGDYAAARRALEEHVAIVAGPDAQNYFPDPETLDSYRSVNNPSLSQARDWLRQIRENERQRVERDEFTQDSKEDYFGVWEIRKPPKPDEGFRKTTSIQGGKLILGVDQKDSKAISRLSVKKKHSSLATFKADFVQRGDGGFYRGIQLTRLSGGGSGGTWTAENAVMLGVDPQGRLYWEVRRFQPDNESQQEVVVEGRLIDIASYNGPIAADEPLQLGLRRRVVKDGGSSFEIIALINGNSVVLPIKDQDVLNNGDLDSENVAVDCGFFVRAVAGVKTSVQVERVEFVFDSNLMDN